MLCCVITDRRTTNGRRRGKNGSAVAIAEQECCWESRLKRCPRAKGRTYSVLTDHGTTLLVTHLETMEEETDYINVTLREPAFSSVIAILLLLYVMLKDSNFGPSRNWSFSNKFRSFFWWIYTENEQNQIRKSWAFPQLFLILLVELRQKRYFISLMGRAYAQRY
jgi:hypothetical protein